MEWLTKLLGGNGSVNIISLYDILQSVGRSGLFRSTFGKTGDTKITPPSTDKSIQSDVSGRGFADEVLFLLAFVTKWADNHGILLDRKLSWRDHEVFLEILRRLNGLDRTKAANLLTHIIGFKGTTKTVKVPKGTRTVGKGANQKTETIYAEYQEDINPSGAHVLIFFGEIGPDKAVELLIESHILDNLEDKAMAATKKAGVEASALQKAGDTKLHVGIAFHKLGYSPTLLKKVLDAPALKKMRAAIDVEADPERKAVLHEEYQALIIKKTKALLKASPHIAKPGWSRADYTIFIGVPALIVLLLIILAIN